MEKLREERIRDAYKVVLELLDGQDNHADYKAFELGYISRDEEPKHETVDNAYNRNTTLKKN